MMQHGGSGTRFVTAIQTQRSVAQVEHTLRTCDVIWVQIPPQVQLSSFLEKILLGLIINVVFRSVVLSF